MCSRAGGRFHGLAYRTGDEYLQNCLLYVNWDIEELLVLKDRILGENLLTVGVRGWDSTAMYAYTAESVYWEATRCDIVNQINVLGRRVHCYVRRRVES